MKVTLRLEVGLGGLGRSGECPELDGPARHPDLSPPYKTRLLAGLADIDTQIRPGPVDEPPPVATDAKLPLVKAGKR